MFFNSNSKIAVIDSGIGGVSVLKQLKKKYNSGNFIYFADNAFMPYGNKSKKTIKKRILSIIKYLKENFHPNVILIACNTASSCLEEDIENVIKIEFDNTKTYLATPLTKQNVDVKNCIADRTLAKIIDNDILNYQILKQKIAGHIRLHSIDNMSEIVLGCTHYELALNIFKECCPNTKILLNSEQMINNIELEQNNQFNVVFLLSKYSKSYVDKLWQVLNN